MLSHLLFANGLNVFLLPFDKRCSPANPTVTSHDIHQT